MARASLPARATRAEETDGAFQVPPERLPLPTRFSQLQIKSPYFFFHFALYLFSFLGFFLPHSFFPPPPLSSSRIKTLDLPKPGQTLGPDSSPRPRCSDSIGLGAVSDRRRDDDPKRGGLPPGLELPPVHGGGGARARPRAHQGGRGECQGRGSPLPRLEEVGAVRFPPYLFFKPVISCPRTFPC